MGLPFVVLFQIIDTLNIQGSNTQAFYNYNCKQLASTVNTRFEISLKLFAREVHMSNSVSFFLPSPVNQVCDKYTGIGRKNETELDFFLTLTKL